MSFPPLLFKHIVGFDAITSNQLKFNVIDILDMVQAANK